MMFITFAPMPKTPIRAQMKAKLTASNISLCAKLRMPSANFVLLDIWLSDMVTNWPCLSMAQDLKVRKQCL